MSQDKDLRDFIDALDIKERNKPLEEFPRSRMITNELKKYKSKKKGNKEK